jgi:flavodoxin
MKTIVIYDSLYGNTQAIAEAIGKALGPDVLVSNVKDTIPAMTRGAELVIVGAPTHGGRPSQGMKAFLKNIPADSLKDIRVAAFDTHNSVDDQGGFVKMLVNFLGTAAKHILKDLEKRGGIAVAAPEGFLVNGKEGPLKEGELQRAGSWATEIRSKMTAS